jgi:hypothetical protein
MTRRKYKLSVLKKIMDEIIDFVERLNKGLIGGNLLMKNLVALKLIHLKKKNYQGMFRNKIILPSKTAIGASLVGSKSISI